MIIRGKRLGWQGTHLLHCEPPGRDESMFRLAADYFFLLRQEKVTKKKATLRRRPSGSLDRGTERGRRQNLSRALASASLRTLAPDFPALRAAIEAASKGEKCKSPMRLVCAKTLLVGAADQPRLRDSGDARWQIITASPETSPSSLASSSAVLPFPSSSSFSASARTG